MTNLRKVLADMSRRLIRFTRDTLPVLLDVAGFVCAVVGVRILFGSGWAWLTAAFLLILAGVRASE